MATQLRVRGAEPVLCGDAAETLAGIRARDCALALWQRPVPVALVAPLARLDLDAIDDIELAIDLPVAATTLEAALVDAGYDAPTAALLTQDIAELATRFADVAGGWQLKLRLEVIETDACRRFHADFVTYRLITTYRGQATQWVRAARPDAIETMQTGEVGIFKGRMLLDEPPVLHRSPPIAATGEQRLLLVLDPVSD